MKKAIRQLLACMVGIWMMGGSHAFAQQMYAPKMPSSSAPAYPVRVAQQPMPAEPENIPNPGGVPAAGNGVPQGVPPSSTPQATPEVQAGPEGQFGFPGLSPNGQPVNPLPPNMQGVETGLWPGCDPGDCCAVCGGGYCQPPLWFTDQDVRFMSRSRPRKKALATVVTPVANTTATVNVNVFNTGKASYDVAPGYYVTVGRYLGRDSQDRDDFSELTFWGFNKWTNSSLVYGQQFIPTSGTDSSGNPIYPAGHPVAIGNLNSPFPSDVGGFNRANFESLNVESEMNNIEWNLRLRPRGQIDQYVLQPNGRWRRECAPGAYVSYLAGVRFMTLGDSVDWNTQGLINDSQTGEHPVFGNYFARTENYLLGLQIGADLIFRRCKWSWGVHSKVGPYFDFAHSIQEIHSQGAGDPFGSVSLNDRFITNKDEASLVGEVGFEANYKFTPNMTGRVSWDFIWISGLALAPEQFQFTDAPRAAINMNGSIFSQALTMGLEWSW